MAPWLEIIAHLPNSLAVPGLQFLWRSIPCCAVDSECAVGDAMETVQTISLHVQFRAELRRLLLVSMATIPPKLASVVLRTLNESGMA